jgi:hypothetical protein
MSVYASGVIYRSVIKMKKDFKRLFKDTFEQKDESEHFQDKRNDKNKISRIPYKLRPVVAAVPKVPQHKLKKNIIMQNGI